MELRSGKKTACLGRSVDVGVAGSDNSTLVLGTRGKRKKDWSPDPLDGSSSLKRIWESHAECNKHRKCQIYDDTYTDLVAADIADTCHFNCRRAHPTPRMRTATLKEWREYDEQIQASQAFHVDYCFNIHVFFPSVVRPAGERSHKSTYQDFMDKVAKYVYSESEGQVQLTDLQLVNATHQGSGRASYKYITFIGKSSLDNVVRCYQAKVCRTTSYTPKDILCDHSVKFVWLRDERGHLTAEDVTKHKQCFGVDSLSQLYRDEFCPIRPVSRDRKMITSRARFKYFVQLAADKASEDLYLGGKKLQDLKMEELYEQLFDYTSHYYISFKGSLDGESSRCYEAKLIMTYDESDSAHYKVDSVWQKDDPGHHLTIEQRIKNREEKEAIKCFDGDSGHQTPHMKNIPGVIGSVIAETINYKLLEGSIVAAAAKASGGKSKLEDLEIEKANKQCLGSVTLHYITFTAKADGERRRYRAKFTRRPYSDGDCECKTKPEWMRTIEFVSRKDGGQVTAAPAAPLLSK